MIGFNLFVSILVLSNLKHVLSQFKSEFTYTLDEGYPIKSKIFGGIAGVAVDRNSNVIIFHRGSHIWDYSSFDAYDVYSQDREKPIPEETVITIDPNKKTIIKAWGKNTFFMPHGLSLDPEGQHVWLTDVALHQVFKYTIDGTKEVLSLGTPFVPGSDENHFCKPTSVADTGDFVFVADGYCNSRVVMFSLKGKYLGEFGQSSDAPFIPSSGIAQPTFKIPHKIVYSKEAKMLCVADRENGRIQCFHFDPKPNKSSQGEGLLLNGAIQEKFTIADPAFNGRLYSLDYSPVGGGIIVAVSGQSMSDKPALGFVYNVTTGQQISKFSPDGQNFGMAHDLAITTDEAETIYVGDIQPVNLWRFSRHISNLGRIRAEEISKIPGINRAMSLMRDKENHLGFFWYVLLFAVIVLIVVACTRARKVGRNDSTITFASLYSSGYPTSIGNMFSSRRLPRRPNLGSRNMFSTMFSRRAFFNLFDRNQQPQNDFSRIPLEDSDNSDDDKSESDIEEFSLDKTPSIKINV